MNNETLAGSNFGKFGKLMQFCCQKFNVLIPIANDLLVNFTKPFSAKFIFTKLKLHQSFVIYGSHIKTTGKNKN